MQKLEDLIKIFKYVQTLNELCKDTNNTTYHCAISNDKDNLAILNKYYDKKFYKKNPSKNTPVGTLPYQFMNAFMETLRYFKLLDPPLNSKTWKGESLDQWVKKIVWTFDGNQDDDVVEEVIIQAQDGNWDDKDFRFEHQRRAIAKRGEPKKYGNKRPPMDFVREGEEEGEGEALGGGLHKNLSEIIELSKKEQSGFVPYKVYNLNGSYSDEYLNKMNSKIKKHFNLFGGFKKVSKEVIGNLSDLDNLLRIDLQNQVMNSLNKKYYKSYNVTNQTGGSGSNQVHILWNAFINASDAERQVFDCIALFMYRVHDELSPNNWREVDINNIPTLKKNMELRVNLKKFMGSTYPNDKTTIYLQRYFHSHWQNNVINLLLMLPPRYRDFTMMATNYWLGYFVDTAPKNIDEGGEDFDDGDGEGDGGDDGDDGDYPDYGGSLVMIGQTPLPDEVFGEIGEGSDTVNLSFLRSYAGAPEYFQIEITKKLAKKYYKEVSQTFVDMAFSFPFEGSRNNVFQKAQKKALYLIINFYNDSNIEGKRLTDGDLEGVSLQQLMIILLYILMANRIYSGNMKFPGTEVGGGWPRLNDFSESLGRLRRLAGDPTNSNNDTIDVGADALTRLVNCDDDIVDKLGNIKENDDDDIFETGFEDDIENQNKMWKVDDEGNYVVIDVRTGKKEEWNISDKEKYKKQFNSSVKCFNSYLEIDKETCCNFMDKLISGDGEAFMKEIGKGSINFEDLQKNFNKQNPFTIKQILKSFKWEKIQTWDPIYKGKLYKYPNFDYWVKNVLENEPDSELSPQEKTNIKTNKELKDILNICVAFVNHNVQLLNPHLEPFEGSPVEIPELKERGVVFYVPQSYSGTQVDWAETQRKILKPYQKFSRNNSLWAVPIFSGDSFMFGGGDQSEQVILTRTPVAPGFSNEVFKEIKTVLDRLKEVNKVLKKEDIKKIQTHLDEFKNLEIKLMKKILTINKYIKVAYALNDNKNEVVSLNNIRQKITDAEDSLKLFQDKDLELKNKYAVLTQLLNDNKL
jgi:hypothetical protein